MAHQVPHVSISYFTSDYSSSEPSLFLAQALVILVSFKLPKHVKLSPSSRSLHMVSPSAGRIAGSFSLFPVSSEKPPPMMLSRLFLCPVPHPTQFQSILQHSAHCFSQGPIICLLMSTILFTQWGWKHNPFIHLAQCFARFVHTKNIYYTNEYMNT